MTPAVAATQGYRIFLLSCYWPNLVPAQAGSEKCPGVWEWNPQEHREIRRQLNSRPRQVRRLILEIGYYNEDLFALARNICAISDQFSAEGWKLYVTTSGVDPNMWHTYFRGITARGALADFEMMNKDPAGRGYVYLNYSYEALAEEILRLDINGVAIPYHGRIEREVPPLFPGASD